MKKIILLMLLCLITFTSKAQNEIDALLAAGVEDAAQFANDYLMPGTDGLIHSINTNWFNTADAKPLGGFEISIIANAASPTSENKSFLMNSADYNNVQFIQGSQSQMVATVLGHNDPDVIVQVTYDDPIFGQQTEDITLPTGLASENINMIPSAFIQGAIGLGKGIELKARFIPKIDTEDVKFNAYGAGVQVEFTKWLPADKLMPIAISGLVAYTHLDATYNLTESSGIQGEDQRLENDTNTLLLQLIASTKLPVINFYGGLGYIKGESESDMLGTYIVSNGVLTADAIVDPFSVSSEVAAVRGTLGTKLKLGFFRINAEYHFSEFNTYSLGINFGFR
ncbi:DUF6588 family protein [Seonamhaeicola maritimus]|uniref:DUF6588 family protein n=1 Tax=Seonamhaeicola maritimus TaxID=2591822 RepID=UPI002495669B|nr:DUF6588 family protein [Seonamhaeicola maritimus]